MVVCTRKRTRGSSAILPTVLLLTQDFIVVTGDGLCSAPLRVGVGSGAVWA